MSVGDWKIVKDSEDHRIKYLCHKGDKHYLHTIFGACSEDPRGWSVAYKKKEKWVCCSCKAVAPEEIAFSALLCDCYDGSRPRWTYYNKTGSTGPR